MNEIAFPHKSISMGTLRILIVIYEHVYYLHAHIYIEYNIYIYLYIYTRIFIYCILLYYITLH